MQARSALFDLYGDYLRPRGGRAPVAALVRLLAPLGVAAPAVRTAISRMVRQGWLLPMRVSDGAGYQLTVKAVQRLDEAAGRIYRTRRATWDGRFDLIVLSLPPRRSDRTKITDTLSYLGYGSLDGSTWVAPRPADQADLLLAEAGIPYERFTAAHTAGALGAAALVGRAWDLDALTLAYRQFVAEQQPTMAATTDSGDDEASYAARFRLVHAWRGFLFRDPHLPPDLLPEPWSGNAAARFFDHHEARLRPAADRFVNRCLSG
jgi:phenylacetic acid degradation operon negative regulatory protein